MCVCRQVQQVAVLLLILEIVLVIVPITLKVRSCSL